MSEIKSPLGTRTMPSNQKQVFSVPDESDDMFNIPTETNNQPRTQTTLTPAQFNELQAKKQLLRTAASKPTSESRQRIEILTGIGRLETKVMIEGHKFTLQSLKSREMREVVKEAAKTNSLSDQMFELRLQTLARSIIYVDDHDINLVLGDSSIESKVLFVDEFEDYVVNHLYACYSDLIKQNENKFVVKTSSEAQEVVDEIKK